MNTKFQLTTPEHGRTGTTEIIRKLQWRSISFAILTMAIVACGKGGSGDSESANSTDPNNGQITELKAFEKTLYKELRNPKYSCKACHSALGEGAPAAFTHDDIAVAFEAVSNLVTERSDKANLSKSPILTKLRPINPTTKTCAVAPHCSDDILDIKNAIVAWSEMLYGIDTTNTAPAISILSASVSASDKKTVSIADKRISDGLLALYLFRDMNNNQVQDLVEPKANLNLSNSWSISLNGGLSNFTDKAANGRATTSQNQDKFFDAIVGADGTGSMQYTVEVWIQPAVIRQGDAVSTTNNATNPASIITYSAGDANRNFTLGQSRNEWTYRNKSSLTDQPNASPNFSTSGQLVKLDKVHLVATFDPQNGRKLYINGVDTDIADATIDPSSTTAPQLTWRTTDGSTPPKPFTLMFGNESDASRFWKGTYFLAAVYSRALRADEVAINFAAGYEDPKVLQFSIKEATGQDGYIEFVAGALDDSGYIFSRPAYVGTDLKGLHLKGIEIRVNGETPVSGQAFRNIDTTLSGNNQLLSTIGSVISQDIGELQDNVSLSFEVVGSNTATPVTKTVGNLSIRTDVRDEKDIPRSGIRTFDQINDTMSELTGVPLISLYNANGNNALGDLRQQLPGTPNLVSFLTAQQVAITKLAGEYCNLLVNTTSTRNSFFGQTGSGRTFNFGENACIAFNSDAKRNFITDALVNRIIGTDLLNQPIANIKLELAGQTDPNSMEHTPGLLDNLVSCNGTTPNMNSPTTNAIVVAACTAVLSSAATMVH